MLCIFLPIASLVVHARIRDFRRLFRKISFVSKKVPGIDDNIGHFVVIDCPRYQIYMHAGMVLTQDCQPSQSRV